MLSEEIRKEYYHALVNKNAEYEGVFYVGVKTTGIFCRPTCSARKPKFENCEFFKTSEEALFALFRPCARCCPLSHPNHSSRLIQDLIEAVEKNPGKKWEVSDFEKLSVDASTVRRQFKKRFGMTFIEYVRSIRMGRAVEQVQKGESVMSVQLDSGYESSSGFREAFTKMIGAAPKNFDDHRNILKASWLDTPLGSMLAVADNYGLYFLEFTNCVGLERAIEQLCKRTQSVIVPGNAPAIASITEELKAYFDGQLREFQTPLTPLGTPFQKLVWKELMCTPYGQTRSYTDQAMALGRKSAYRAVANANGRNPIAIVVPCHRIINHSGKMGGYGGGLVRKRWLLELERKYIGGSN